MSKNVAVGLIILALIVGLVVGIAIGPSITGGPQQTTTEEQTTQQQQQQPATQHEPVIKTIGIVVTGDEQSQLFPTETKVKIYVDGNKVKVPVTVGGYTRLASLVKGLKDDFDGLMVFSTGDTFSGPVYNKFHGIPDVEAMNAIPYTAMVLGNHEFDLGVDVLANALKNAKFDVLVANAQINDEALKDIVKPYVVKDIAGIKVGIFGLITPDLARITNVGNAVVTSDPFKTAEDIVKKLRDEEKVDLVIALTHIGTNLDEQLAEKVKGIDLIIGGHTHDTFYKKVGDTIIVHAGAKLHEAGIVSLLLKDGKIAADKGSFVFLGEDANVQNLLADYKAKLDELYNEVIGESKVDLDGLKKDVRTKETNLGNLITDAFMYRFPDADLAITNGGGIRGDKIYPAGPITYKTLLEIHPFGNTVVMVQLTGDELKRVFEISGSALRVKDDGCPDENRAPTGGFLQVSGVKVTYDLSKKPFCAEYDGRNLKKIINEGERVVSLEVYNKETGKYEPVDPNKTYTVLINSWMAGGGDGYYIFMDKDQTDTNMTIPDVLMYYIQKHSPIAPKVEGRITIQGGTPVWGD